jgi:hypothetical protein
MSRKYVLLLASICARATPMTAQLAAAIRMIFLMALSSALRVRSSLSVCTYTLSAYTDMHRLFTEVVQADQSALRMEPFSPVVQHTMNMPAIDAR